jgi:RND family efflux transporter MFP subunit
MRHPLRATALLLLFVAACGGGDAPATDEHAEEEEEVHTEVTLTAEARTRAGIEVAPVTLVRSTPASLEDALEVPGHVEVDPRRVGVVSARSAGRLERLFAVEGDVVEAGAPVAEMFSPSFQVAQADLVQSLRRAELLRSSADSLAAAQLAVAAAQRLRVLGASEDDLAALRRGDPPQPLQPLRAPLTGSVIASQAVAGAALEAGAAVVTIADLTELDVVAEIPEIALPTVRVGQVASVTVAAFPDRRFRGTIERIRDVLDPETRTVRAVLHVPNPARDLRPGMYASVRIGVTPRGSDATAGALRIPSSAVIFDGTETIVFVETAERTYQRRVVNIEGLTRPGSLNPSVDAVLVRAGLREGERIVTRGAFVLKSELGKAALGEH